jgi:DeoR/GlpR family transcriptional regulator of sugar metabolism
MIPAERQHSILTMLEQKEIVSIAELIERLGVSHMTVRRDMQQLENEGRVTLVSGGARLAEGFVRELSRKVKQTLREREKIAIAKRAALHVPYEATVYLDAGTTCFALAVELAGRDDITVVTNDFVVAAYLSTHSACSLYHTGGQVLRVNESCVGDSAARFIRNVNIAVGFISASSWDARFISTPAEAKVPVKKAIVEASSKRILVCDSSKYGKVAFFKAIAISDLHTIITDTGLNEQARETLAATGVGVELVEG